MADLAVSLSTFLRSMSTTPLPRDPRTPAWLELVEVEPELNTELAILENRIFPRSHSTRERVNPQTEVGRCIAVVANGRMVACASMKREKPRWFAKFWPWTKVTAHFYSIGVDQICRRLKIGSHLMHAALCAAMRDWNVTSCDLLVGTSNKAARNLYRKFGFNCTGRRAVIRAGFETELADEMRVTDMRNPNYAKFLAEMRFDKSS